MDTRFLPFYGGLYGGALQPYLYNQYGAYGMGYGWPFGMYGNYGQRCGGGYDVGTPASWDGGYGGYGGNYPLMGYGSYGYGFYGY